MMHFLGARLRSHLLHITMAVIALSLLIMFNTIVPFHAIYAPKANNRVTTSTTKMNIVAQKCSHCIFIHIPTQSILHTYWQ